MGCGQSKKAAKPAAPPAEAPIEIFGAPVSMNALSSIVMVQQYKVGKMIETFPGDATKTPEFLKMNPYHAIPTMRHGTFCLAESSAILRYIAAAKAKDLYPEADTARCAFIDWAMDRVGGPISKHVGQTVYPILGFATPPEKREEAGKNATLDLQEFVDFFLKEKFVGGEKPSIADYKIAPFFFGFAHPKVKSESFVEVPARVLQFNRDFLQAVPAAAIFSEGLKGLLDGKDAKPGDVKMLECPEAATEVKVQDRLAPAAKKGGKGKIEVMGLPLSANSCGSIMLAVESGAGQMTATQPGEATRTDAFLAMNPFHAIPTLKDGDFAVADSNAILRYLGMEYAPETYGKLDAERRAQVDWALERFSSPVYPTFVNTVYPALGFMPGPEKEEDRKANAKAAMDHMKAFCDHFLKDKFVGGDKLSVADYKIAPFFFAWAHPKVKEEYFVEVPERVVKFNTDFAAACKSSSMLSEAGGYSLKEMLEPKPAEKADEGAPAAAEITEAMVEDLREDLPPVREDVVEVEASKTAVCC